MSPYYGPTPESPSEVMLERTFLSAGYLTGFGFGVQLVIYCACIYTLWTKQQSARSTKIFIPYLTLLCLLNLLWTATSAYGLQLTFIDNRNYPGGVIGFLGIEFALPTNVASTASYIASNLLADALMVWRCYVVWSAAPNTKRATTLAAIALPSFMFLGSLILAILFALQTTGPEGLFSSITTAFGTPFFGLSMVLNMVITALIAVRIWDYRRRGQVSSTYGDSKISFGAIFIESAALYSIISLLLVVTFSIQHPINQIWLGLAPATQLVANYLIILRIAYGTALARDSDSTTTTSTEGYGGSEEEKPLPP
ncbi:hypothetical protein E1B28_000722 [Marasmius oreades]|uniref:Uncharacterized protein n=1 Tax=Marasmius oreades TaxID=181124 RepID=A0A9P8AEM9_9AGAR|nr:uncharacterized protein E1B28_000722 [Marasmius oreades]KAG7098817.1 hypothetical protein E1B28_000722 [Marasmius oreades]